MHSAAIIAAKAQWSAHLSERLHPGAHVALLTADEYQAIEARRAGFEIRDTLLLLWPQTTSFAFLLRTPFPGGTTDQIEMTGTGVLHVDACRIAADLSEFFSATGKPRSGMGHAKGYGMGEGYGGDRANPPHVAGRWPANACFIHGPACQRIGEKRIDGHKGYPNGPGGSSVQFSQKGTVTTRAAAWAGHADADGKETVAVWACQDDCPVKLVDKQSGITTSGAMKREVPGYEGNSATPFLRGRSGPSNQHGDSGGASRFYPQFASPWELLGWLRTLISTPGGQLLEEV